MLESRRASISAILMLLAAVSRMARYSTMRQFMAGVGVVAVVAAALLLSQPLLVGMGNYNLIIFFLVLLGACQSTPSADTTAVDARAGSGGCSVYRDPDKTGSAHRRVC